MKFINLTNHDIYEVTTKTHIPRSGKVVELHTATHDTAIVNNIRVFRTVVYGLSGLPAPQEGVMYIVSALAMNGIPADRTDVVCPYKPVRNAQGKVYGCKGFRCN